MSNATPSIRTSCRHGYWKDIASIAFLFLAPLILAIYVTGVVRYDLTIPLVYEGSDDVWQLVLTKFLRDTGWVLTNTYLGAPDIAVWKYHDAAQTSALHSVIMLGIFFFTDDAVKVQQIYYLLNFPLIALTSYVACRLIGISRLPAICVGFLFAFTSFRFADMMYAFLANYFMVPLALVPVYWIASGEFSAIADRSGNYSSRLKSFFTSRQFLLGLVFVALLATSDGYYAFFELLLLGFGFAIRVFRGALVRPLELLAPIAYVVAIIGVALLLASPLNSYRKAHTDEFFPNGVQDPALIKHPFEAEVYSSTLKMMITPQYYNRMPFLAEIGKKIVKTSDDALLFKKGASIVPLSGLCTIFFFIAIVLLMAPSVDKAWIYRLSTQNGKRNLSVFNSFLSISLFIFLCSIMGGVGTLVALVFPTIRAYDRFPLFLIFTLLSAGAYVASLALDKISGKSRILLIGAIVLVTALALFDQIPADSDRTSALSKNKFLAERNFVHGVEASVAPGSMIYQYPHSQYLENSSYYGWGSFAHIRLYLHSKALRWSNGASKNSPVENWHLRVAALPMDEMINEIEAAGFAGIVIDRSVVPDDEYRQLAALLTSRGMTVTDDAPSKLAFAKLSDPGFRLEYGKDFRQADKLIVTSRQNFDLNRLPRQIDRHAVSQLMQVGYVGEQLFTVERDVHPDVFIDMNSIDEGAGSRAVAPLSVMAGSLSCKLPDHGSAVEVSVQNTSSFDWTLQSGNFPLSFGVHIKSATGEVIQFDDGTRFPLKKDAPPALGKRLGRIVIESGKTKTFVVPLSELSQSPLPKGAALAEFAMVQDGNAWFNNLKCEVPVSQ